MGISKVVYNGETLIDTSTTTVTPETLARGVTAINASGESIEGTLELADCGITYLESTDTENLVSIRELESGSYVFYGKFKPFSTSTSTLTFSSKLLVNVITRTSDTQVMVFYPVNNCVQYLNITDDTYERKNIYLNDLATTTSVTEAITEAVANVLPTVTASDAGKFLRVSADGTWVAEYITNAEGMRF